ncbi:MAG: DUF1540 domain-containing protein [Firmicutes bacterium]|nr:DUF1540 domain-containing protein [Bacillota bacterium]
MGSPRVECEVDTCTHWLTGDRCAAANIDILNEDEARMSEIAEQTECKTFYNRSGITSYLGSMDNVNWVEMAREPFEEGKQLTPSVTCVVDSCKYWSTGEQCHAEAIKVTGQGADECQDTNCGTFEK